MILFKNFVLLAFVSCLLFACKKVEVNEIKLVKNKFIGKWPVKVRILDTLFNGISNGPDTLTLSTIDTLMFSAEGKLTSNIYNTTYSFDASAENITYNTMPTIKWKIDFLRIKSIILSSSRTEMIGGVTTVYKIEEQLIK